MQNKLVTAWHAYMDKPSPEALEAMLHEDCSFISPVVFTPQKGRDITMTYLLSAGQVFHDTKFRYVNELIGTHRMVLEFEAEIDGKYVNGVDIIDFNDEGKITQFKVMVRPLQAVNMLWEKMAATLDQMKTS
ncbi:MAG: nuclear transport factor 2 family protein [Parvibaculales bacterium]|nr:nuclear transport factor 2 family protein [bacterium]